MEEVFVRSSANAVVMPYMVRGATDGSFLRQKGMDVYGVPLFIREDKESRAHGNDERISLESLRAGDRKSTRLNSSHQIISYAVFCLKKKKKQKCQNPQQQRTTRP